MIFWCTGLSGAGKTAIAVESKKHLEAIGLALMVVGGDKVRASYGEKLGFGRSDVEKNNLHIVSICEAERKNYDIIIVSAISSIDHARKIAREKLEPFFYLIYLSCEIDSLKKRDPKGLYGKADRGQIVGLIGYSASNPYDVPMDADFTLNTTPPATLEVSGRLLLGLLIKKFSRLGLSPGNRKLSQVGCIRRGW